MFQPQKVEKTETCQELTCELNWEVKTDSSVKGGLETCCPRQHCEPIRAESLVRCPEVVEPTCMEFQEVKTMYDANNCTKYVCGKLIAFTIRTIQW